MNSNQRITLLAGGLLLLASALFVATGPRGTPLLGGMLSGGPIGMILMLIAVFIVLGLLTLLTIWRVDRGQRR